MKKIVSLLLSALILVTCSIGAFAADLETVSAYINYGITIRYNGEVQTMYDANNARVYPITYNGTTYLPVRAVSNMLSVPVEWDGANNTVWLGEKPEMMSASAPEVAPELMASLESVNGLLNYGITIRFNGRTQLMYDEQGGRVFPITYNGTTYLPVRAVSNMLSVSVRWDGPNNTVWLSKPETVIPRGVQGKEAYENKFLGLGFRTADNWSYYTDAGIQSVMGTNFSGTYMEQLDAEGQYCDVYITCGKMGNMTVVIHKKTNEEKVLTSEALFEKYYNAQAAEYNAMYDSVTMGTAYVNIGGKNFYTISTHCLVNGVGVHQRSILVDTGDCLANVSVSAYFESTVNDYLDRFYLVQ